MPIRYALCIRITVFLVPNPDPIMSPKKIRLAAVGDLHYGKASPGLLQPLMMQINQSADILLLAVI